jgi:hypothetical protein
MTLDWDLLQKSDTIFGILGGIVLIINLIFFIPKLISYIYRRFKTYHLEGEWYGYYFTYSENQSILKGEEWMVRKGFQKNLIVDVQTLPDKRLSYQGEIYLQRNNLIVRLKASEYDEDTFCIFNAPIPGNDAVVVGLWLGLDFNGQITVGPGILSRKPLINKDLRSLMVTKIQADDSARTLRIY